MELFGASLNFYLYCLCNRQIRYPSWNFPRLKLFFLKFLPVEHRSYNRVFKISYAILMRPPPLPPLKCNWRFSAKLVLPTKQSFYLMVVFPLKGMKKTRVCSTGHETGCKPVLLLMQQYKSWTVELGISQPWNNFYIWLAIKMLIFDPIVIN